MNINHKDTQTHTQTDKKTRRRTDGRRETEGRKEGLMDGRGQITEGEEKKRGDGGRGNGKEEPCVVHLRSV